MEHISRKDFIKMVGAGAVLALIGCTGACTKSSDPAPVNTNTGTGTSTGKIDFTVDFSTSSFQTLSQNGSFVIKDSILIARTSKGEFIAVAKDCTHQGFQLSFSADALSCSLHGSKFSTTGSVLNGPASTALKAYKTELKGTVLRVYEG
jgi:cytochrome b6-f complex iron-sulfur subunit